MVGVATREKLMINSYKLDLLGFVWDLCTLYGPEVRARSTQDPCMVHAESMWSRAVSMQGPWGIHARSSRCLCEVLAKTMQGVCHIHARSVRDSGRHEGSVQDPRERVCS